MLQARSETYRCNLTDGGGYLDVVVDLDLGTESEVIESDNAL